MVKYGILWYCILLNSTVQYLMYFMLLYDIIWYSMILYNTAWYFMYSRVLYGTLWLSMVLHVPAWHCMLLYIRRSVHWRSGPCQLVCGDIIIKNNSCKRLLALLVVNANVASLYLPLYPFTRHSYYHMSDINRICRQVSTCVNMYWL